MEKTLTPAKVLAKLSLMSDENRMVLAIKMSKLDMEKGDESTTLEDEQLELALKASMKDIPPVRGLEST